MTNLSTLHKKWVAAEIAAQAEKNGPHRYERRADVAVAKARKLREQWIDAVRAQRPDLMTVGIGDQMRMTF
jgi:hypothetical protein